MAFKSEANGLIMRTYARPITRWGGGGGTFEKANLAQKHTIYKYISFAVEASRHVCD